MTKDEIILSMPGYEFVLKPVLDKKGNLFYMKHDKRFRSRSLRIKLKVDGGWVEADFVLKRIETIHHDGHRTRVFL